MDEISPVISSLLEGQLYDRDLLQASEGCQISDPDHQDPQTSRSQPKLTLPNHLPSAALAEKLQRM